LRTKKKSDARFSVHLIGIDRVSGEHVRASLRGGPFHFYDGDEPFEGEPSGGEPDLYVASAARAGELAGRSAPVIACGPARLLRGAFLDGCADFLREPWAPEELELRALAVLARARRDHTFSWGTVSFEGQDLVAPKGVVRLTHHESRVLRLLLRARGEPVPRDAIAYELWGNPQPARGRAIDAHVAALRRKVRRAVPEAARFIVAVRGKGYLIP